MMKRLRLILAMVVGVMALASCDSSNKLIEVDFTPIVFRFDIVDSDGNNLVTKDIYDKGDESTVLVYNDVPYTLKSYHETFETLSRYYMPVMRGFYVSAAIDDEYSLYFGELDGAQNYKKKTITLKWADGSEDKIVFSHKVVGITKVDRTVTVNGKSNGRSTNITLVKKAVNNGIVE